MEFAFGAPFHYRVVGLPKGPEANIAEFSYGWRVWRDTERNWRGEYGSADEALAALQSEIDTG